VIDATIYTNARVLDHLFKDKKVRERSTLAKRTPGRPGCRLGADGELFGSEIAETTYRFW